MDFLLVPLGPGPSRIPGLETWYFNGSEDEKDRDSCYLFEIRCYAADNTLVRELTVPFGVAELIGKAIPEVASTMATFFLKSQ